MTTKQRRGKGRKTGKEAHEIPELFRNALESQADDEMAYRKSVALLTGKGPSLALEIELKRAARRESRRRRKKERDFEDYHFAEKGGRGVGKAKATKTKAKKEKLTKAQRRKASSTSLRGKYNIFD